MRFIKIILALVMLFCIVLAVMIIQYQTPPITIPTVEELLSNPQTKPLFFTDYDTEIEASNKVCFVTDTILSETFHDSKLRIEMDKHFYASIRVFVDGRIVTDFSLKSSGGYEDGTGSTTICVKSDVQPGQHVATFTTITPSAEILEFSWVFEVRK